MIAVVCQHENRRTNGTTKSGAVRYRCKTCGKSWTESTELFAGMRIGVDKAAQIIELLCEGNTVRGAMRISGADKNTVLSLLKLVGERCEVFLAKHIRGVHVDAVQVDEIWQYVFCKKATAKQMNYVGGCGDSWCFTAIERHTKLLVAWHMGRRTEADTDQFMAKLDRATEGHFHISTDGFKCYPNAVRRYLTKRVDHGVMTKIYGRSITYPIGTYLPGPDNGRGPHADARLALPAGPDMHEPRRTPQRLNPSLHAADDSAHVRVLEAMGQSPGGFGDLLLPLQLVQETPQPRRPHPRDGARPC